MTISPEDRKFIRDVNRALARGQKLIEIAEAMEISPQTVTQRAARLGYRIERKLVPIQTQRRVA